MWGPLAPLRSQKPLKATVVTCGHELREDACVGASEDGSKINLM